MKLVLLMAATVLSISVLSACGTDTKQTNQSTSTNSSSQNSTDKKAANTSTSASNSNAAEKASSGQVVEINVNAKDFEFDKKVIHVKKGDKIKLTLKSDDGGHGFALPAFNVDIQGNGSAEFTADKTGTYEYHCSIMCGSGHTNMTGKLVVE